MTAPGRDRLIARLAGDGDDLAEPARIIVLRAPAGYGKTAAVAGWLGPAGERPGVHWMRCAPGSADTLWADIVRELGDLLDSSEAGSPEARSASTRSVDPIDAAISLAGRLREPLTLVVDDYHRATTAENDLAFAALASAAPMLTLVVIGRRVCVLDGPLVTGRLRVRVLGPHELALTRDESLELAAQAGAPDDERLRTALDQAAGWPMALRVALDRGSHAPDDAPHDPLANLNRFALHHLEITGDLARRVLLAASQLDAITLDQAAEFTGADVPQVRTAVHELLELGVLTPAPGADTTEFRCHPAVQTHLAARSRRSFSPEQRAQLLLGRADRIRGTAPFSAFKTYCAAEAYSEAEILLAQHFTTFTDEVEEAQRVLRTLPEAVFAERPTFTAARLFLAMPDPTVPPTALTYLAELWRRGLALVDGEGREAAPELTLPLIAESMVAARLDGRLDEAGALAHRLETRLRAAEIEDDPLEITGTRPQGETPTVVLRGALPTYYREIASTALMAGDLPSARRNWEQLLVHAESLIAAPWYGFAQAETRTVTDVESGRRWLLAALSEMAFTELIDGDMRRCAELLAEADGLIAEHGTTPPGLSWIGGEISRAHLAYELGDAELLQQAIKRLTPLIDRIEQWPLLLVAEAESMRRRRGPSWALSQLRAAMADIDETRRRNDQWNDSLSGYLAMLHTVLSDFASAERALERLDPELPLTRVERARLALFSGDDVEALLLAQRIGDPGTRRRQQLDRCLITAVAAWSCEKPQDALTALANAASLMQACRLPSALWGVPHEPLREVAVAAREAGACDLVELIDAMPETVRCRRYDQLTEMERRTLVAIAEHQSTNDAASALFITPGTVKKHLASVYRKLHARGRNEAILQARRMGLLPGAEA